jgi:hypothetical protein
MAANNGDAMQNVRRAIGKALGRTSWVEGRCGVDARTAFHGRLDVRLTIQTDNEILQRHFSLPATAASG